MSTIDDEIQTWLSPSNPAYLHAYKTECDVAQALLELRTRVAMRAACHHLPPHDVRRVLQELIAEMRNASD
jgi:hypothetical protein